MTAKNKFIKPSILRLMLLMIINIFYHEHLIAQSVCKEPPANDPQIDSIRSAVVGDGSCAAQNIIADGKTRNYNTQVLERIASDTCAAGQAMYAIFTSSNPATNLSSETRRDLSDRPPSLSDGPAAEFCTVSVNIYCDPAGNPADTKYQGRCAPAVKVTPPPATNNQTVGTTKPKQTMSLDTIYCQSNCNSKPGTKNVTDLIHYSYLNINKNNMAGEVDARAKFICGLEFNSKNNGYSYTEACSQYDAKSIEMIKDVNYLLNNICLAKTGDVINNFNCAKDKNKIPNYRDASFTAVVIDEKVCGSNYSFANNQCYNKCAAGWSMMPDGTCIAGSAPTGYEISYAFVNIDKDEKKPIFKKSTLLNCSDATYFDQNSPMYKNSQAYMCPKKYDLAYKTKFEQDMTLLTNPNEKERPEPKTQQEIDKILKEAEEYSVHACGTLKKYEASDKQAINQYPLSDANGKVLPNQYICLKPCAQGFVRSDDKTLCVVEKCPPNWKPNGQRSCYQFNVADCVGGGTVSNKDCLLQQYQPEKAYDAVSSIYFNGINASSKLLLKFTQTGMENYNLFDIVSINPDPNNLCADTSNGILVKGILLKLKEKSSNKFLVNVNKTNQLSPSAGDDYCIMPDGSGWLANQASGCPSAALFTIENIVTGVQGITNRQFKPNCF